MFTIRPGYIDVIFRVKIVAFFVIVSVLERIPVTENFDCFIVAFIGPELGPTLFFCISSSNCVLKWTGRGRAASLKFALASLIVSPTMQLLRPILCSQSRLSIELAFKIMRLWLQSIVELLSSNAASGIFFGFNKRHQQCCSSRGVPSICISIASSVYTYSL
jgi:hypothetical protein